MSDSSGAGPRASQPGGAEAHRSGGLEGAPRGVAHPFGQPLDPALLEEPAVPASRPLPLRALLLLALPAAAMALSVLWQKLSEGPLQLGDAAGRWLWQSALLGAPLGALVGLLLERGALRRLAWTLWGAIAPLVIVALILGASQATHPLRERLAERAADKCRLTRRVCSLTEFRAACTAAGVGARARERAEEQLGAPAQSLCSGSGCTHRWLYAGPWTPDNWVAPGSVLCSLVVDVQGNAVRAALGPGLEQP